MRDFPEVAYAFHLSHREILQASITDPFAAIAVGRSMEVSHAGSLAKNGPQALALTQGVPL